MKLRIPIVHYEDINLSKEDVNAVILNYIYNKYKVASDTYEKEGFLCHEVEYCTSHCWYQEERIRKATEFDKFLLQFIKELKDNV